MLSVKLIIKAFEKTGAHPINQNAITAEQMVPSYKSSLQTVFPAHLASPVKAILAAHHTIHAASQSAVLSSVTSAITHSTQSDPLSSHPSPSVKANPTLYSPSKQALHMNFLLGQTSANYLVAMPDVMAGDMASIGAGDVVRVIPDTVYE
ncbi:hypothetical protein FRB95_001497 [Tulasnella sp. JGI-2019a]|nr:hypothetical protein FRB93_005869 [Tulasnella sp. JGI-2019a]KAG9021768.1 hypothetical protein FRB95_001497 [Tulasnella sp. JGI-2019a]